MMKFKVSLYLFYFIALSSNAQSRWFKVLPGFNARNTFIYNDTLITFGLGRIGPAFVILKHHSSITSGKHYYTDTIDYFEISGDSSQTSEIYFPDQFYLDSSNGKFKVGFSYSDKVNGRYKWRSGVFDMNPLTLFTSLSHDTFDTKLNQFSKIGSNYYSIVVWRHCTEQNNCNTNHKLIKFSGNQGLKTIRQRANPICLNCHAIEFDKIHEDIKDKKYLFLQQTDKWDFGGDANAWQGEIIKIDTNGGLQWKSRPNQNDSVNTSFFRMVQKPDGNLICSWTDEYHPPHKHPDWDNFFADTNDSSTLWFAEIDYQTGKVLWRKNLREYLRSRLTQGTVINYAQNVHIYDVKRADNHLLWIGTYRKIDTLKPYGKDLTLVLKTDFNINPIWMRQHEFFPLDTGDKGMTPYSLIQLQNDSGIILTGDYENQYGQASNGQLWYKGALLRLDKNGCFLEGCLDVDTLEPIKIRLYPNPANNSVVIDFFSNFEEWEINVFDIQGRLLVSKIPTDGTYSLNIDNYPSGIYIFNLVNSKSNEYRTFKVIVYH